MWAQRNVACRSNNFCLHFQNNGWKLQFCIVFNFKRNFATPYQCFITKPNFGNHCYISVICIFFTSGLLNFSPAGKLKRLRRDGSGNAQRGHVCCDWTGLLIFCWEVVFMFQTLNTKLIEHLNMIFHYCVNISLFDLWPKKKKNHAGHFSLFASQCGLWLIHGWKWTGRLNHDETVCYTLNRDIIWIKLCENLSVFKGVCWESRVFLLIRGD